MSHFNRSPARKKARAAGYRSGLEQRIAERLRRLGVAFEYEKFTVVYERPPGRYTPDFKLPNGILVEVKGQFMAADRQKHLYIKAQHPELDIRFVFADPHKTLSANSKTTYADWCMKHGFDFAGGDIPDHWLTHKKG